MDHVRQGERFDKRREVVGVGVHLVAGPGLRGPSMPPTIVGDGAIALGGQEEQLLVPGVGVERPAVAEDHRLTRSPILVIDLCSVLRGDGRHMFSL